MEERFALLIDADNVSAKYIKPILDELSKYGNVTYKRIYGDWTRPNSAGWKEELLQNSITPIQQFSYTYGKNATDSAMIIDAMDMLYASELEGFCLVSSDSDFTRLASRLRESGKRVIGMGEAKTPLPFRNNKTVLFQTDLLSKTVSLPIHPTGQRQTSRACDLPSHFPMFHMPSQGSVPHALPLSDQEEYPVFRKVLPSFLYDLCILLLLSSVSTPNFTPPILQGHIGFYQLFCYTAIINESLSCYKTGAYTAFVLSPSP